MAPRAARKKALAPPRFGNANWIATFAQTGKEVDVALERAGASRVLPLEVVDKNGDAETTLVGWKHEILKMLGSRRADAGPQGCSVQFLQDFQCT